MLQKVTLRARRSYNWICSDCQKRLGYSVGQTKTVRSFNCPSSARRSRLQPSIWRRQVVFSGISPGISSIQTRLYTTDGRPPGDIEDPEDPELVDPDNEIPEEYSDAYAEDRYEPEEDDVAGFIKDLNDPSVDLSDPDVVVKNISFHRDPANYDPSKLDPSPRDPSTYDPYSFHERPRLRPEHPRNMNYVFLAEDGLEDEKAPPRDISKEPPIPRRVAAELQDPSKAPDWTRTNAENYAIWKRKQPLTRAKLLADLEYMNAKLAKGGLQLIEPRTRRVHRRTITSPESVTPGFAISLWQRFKIDYAKRYRDGDQSLFLGRPREWTPTVREMKMEYQRFYWNHKSNITQWYADRKFWTNAPDLRLCFANSLHMLERFTKPEVFEKFGFRETPHHKVPLSAAGTTLQPGLDLEDGGGNHTLDSLASEWQGPLREFEPDSYDTIETTVEERDRIMRSLRNWSPPGILPRELDEFRVNYLGKVDIEALATVFKVPIKKLPLTPAKLLTLLKSMMSLKVSKQDVRYLLPPGYVDSNEFIAQTVVSLILIHEQNGTLNTNIMNTAINYQMRTSQIKKGRHLIDLMDHLKIHMNVGTFRDAIKAAAKVKDFFVLERLMRRMMLKKIKFDHEVWRMMLLCCHTPGQQLQIFRLMKKIGLDPKRLAPGPLIQLTFKMYKDQLRRGASDVPVPWKNLAGIHLDAQTLNPILEFLYEHHAYDDARTLFYRASKQLKMIPNYGTMRIIVRQGRRTGKIIPMVKTVRVFEERFGIEAEGDVMTMIFQQAHRFRYYNVVRTVWAHACLRNMATKTMIARMRHDIYETGRYAGKPGKLALGVCSEDTEAIVKMPIWAMRLVSKARDPLGYLASEGQVYQNPELMKDLNDRKERAQTLRDFQKQAVTMRLELLRMDLHSHTKFKPRRPFSIDLVDALRRDLFLREKYPGCHDWSLLTWAWSLFQVRRIRVGEDIQQVLAWEKAKMQQEEARKAGNTLDEERIWARNYALLDNMPNHLSIKWLDPAGIEESNIIPESLLSSSPRDTETDTEERGNNPKQSGKEDLYAFYEAIVNEDLDSLAFAADDDDLDEEPKAHFESPFLEREMGAAIDDAIKSWQEPLEEIEGEDNIMEEFAKEERRREEESFFWDDYDSENTENIKRKEAVEEADEVLDRIKEREKKQEDSFANYVASLELKPKSENEGDGQMDYNATKET